MSVGRTEADVNLADRTKMAHQVCAGLAVVSLLICIVSPLVSSQVFLIVPLFGLASMAVGIYGRAWWGCVAGLLELISPAVLIYLTYYLLAHGA
ncbi:hypothetical protein [Brachybacterium tyrofermentans]|uniref:Uncharacterized protein n=1 Tax=Brachybacterium tyrofermentans TaxID=47848 RepID=A0ABW0FIC1_9MICO